MAQLFAQGTLTETKITHWVFSQAKREKLREAVMMMNPLSLSLSNKNIKPVTGSRM